MWFTETARFQFWHKRFSWWSEMLRGSYRCLDIAAWLTRRELAVYDMITGLRMQFEERFEERYDGSENGLV